MNKPQSTYCLTGNVKVGKTTLFHGMTAEKRKEVEIPGSPVTYFSGTVKAHSVTLIDPPGIGSVFVKSEDEQVSRNLFFYKGFDGIIQVLDASNMRRSLTLTLQLAEFGIPMVLSVNMDDIAQTKGISIDLEKLQVLLGVKAVRTVAREGLGTSALLETLKYAATPKQLVKFPKDIDNTISKISFLLKTEKMPSRGLALMLLNGDTTSWEIVKKKFGEPVRDKCKELIDELKQNRKRDPGLVLSEIFIHEAMGLADEIVTRETQFRTPFLMALSRHSSSLVAGIPIALSVIFMMYLWVGMLGADLLVVVMEGQLFGEFIIPMVASWLKPLNSQLITDFFCGDFGLVSVGLGLAFGVLFPVLLTFYVFLGMLEDSGYMPRLSILLDKVFRKMGLNGKGVLPLIMGFSCITMAIMTARMLETKKERIIVSLLLTLGIPCAPMLSIIFVIMAKLHWTALPFIFLILSGKILLVGAIADKLVGGKRGDFIIELPLLRLPNFLLVFRRAWMRLVAFMKEAVPIFVAATAGIFVFDKIGGLEFLRIILAPTADFLLGLPKESVEVLVMTLVRREAGVALLDQLFSKGAFNGLQSVVILIVMTSLLPCVNAVIVLFKERGLKTSFAIIGFVMPAAIITGTLVNWGCRAVGVSF